MADNKRKLYDELSKRYDLGTFEKFSDDIQDETKRRKLYDATSQIYNYGSYERFSGQLGFGGSQDAVADAPAEADSAVQATTDAQSAVAGKDVQSSAPTRTWTPQENKYAVQSPSEFKSQSEKPFFGPGEPVSVPEKKRSEPAPNPFPYRGGLEREMEGIREEKAKVGAVVVDDLELIKEYDRRLKEYHDSLDPTSKKTRENEKWLREHKAAYQAAKEGGWMKEYSKIEAEESNTENAIGNAETEIARKKNREAMGSPADIVATGKTALGNDNIGRRDSEYELRKMADELYASAEKEYGKSSKYDEETGAVGQFLNDVWNNIDSGSFTLGASKGLAEKMSREVGEKYNSLIEGAMKDMKMSEADIKAVLSSIEAAGPKLQQLEEELKASSAEIDAMAETYEEMVRRGDPDARAYGRELQKKIDEYNKRINEEYKPAWDAYDRDREAYEKVMAAIDAAVENGLTDGEKAVLDALEKFTEAKTLRSDDVSVAGKAGAGAEQSAEFMLDFILTGGLEKAGAKVAAKLATKRALKRKGAEFVKDLARVGKTVKPGLGLRMATDFVTSLARTGVMMPRTLQAYGDNAIEYSGKDAAGRIEFDRTQANALGNSLLSQFIEYWSEGFGEYFGEAESALFRSVTKSAPREMIGRTLKGYRGSIGQFLDKGKFNGMFNEMLEEVVGSSFNALSGWLSGDRVGDADAMKEFFAGENLATLTLSFLPMSAIGAATNVAAYHNMKRRYNKGVEALNPFIESGAVSRQELEQLSKDIPNMTPAEVKDKIVDISDRARKANGGRLPSDFAQNLMGYIEGEFAMSLRYDEWDESREKMAVVNSYTYNYSNPDARNAWDLNDAEATARKKALDAGFSEEDLNDKDAYLLAQDAFEMKNLEPDRADVLMEYANAKAAAEGLRNGYAEQTDQVADAYADNMTDNVAVNGTVTTANIMLGGRAATVYITQDDATVSPEGAVSTPTGASGVVKYRLNETGKEQTAPAYMFSGARRSAADRYIAETQEEYRQKRAEVYEKARNTVSPAGREKSVAEKVGHTVIVSDNEGVYQPVMVERMTNDGAKVVLRGDKKALQGIAEAMGQRVPTSDYLEAEVSRLWPLLAKEKDGSLSSGLGEKPKQTTSPKAQEAAPATEQSESLRDLRDRTVPISVGGVRMDAHVLNTADGRVVYELLDADGNVTRTASMPEAEFQNALQRAQEPAPAGQANVTPISSEDFDPGSIDFDNNYVVLHQTGSQNFDSILRNGLRVGAGLNGTTTIANRETLESILRAQKEGRGHEGSDGLVIMQIPKSWTNGREVRNLDQLDDVLMDRFGEGALQTVPAEVISHAIVTPKKSESGIPVNEETGEKIYDAPGVTVEDAIADLYATEGLTDEDVDKYIADRAANAEAARNPEMGDMSPQAWGRAKMEAARVADFWSAMKKAAEARRQQQEAPARSASEAKPRMAEPTTPVTIESKRKITSRLKDWSRRTGVKVSIARSIDDVKDEQARRALKDGRALTGWYNDKTGEVEVYLPNVVNSVEADKTFIHEVVAHKGLRGLLGEDSYNELCDKVWNELMTPEEQVEFMNYNRHLQGSEEYLHRAAADEFIARLSERLDMPDKRSIFQKIVDWIMDRLGLGGDVSGIEKGAADQVAGAGTITRSELYDLLEDSLKRFEKGRKKVSDILQDENGDVRFSEATYLPFKDEFGNEHAGTKMQLINYLTKNGFPQKQIDDFVQHMDYWYDFTKNVANLVNPDGSFRYKAFHDWSETIPAYKMYEGKIVKAISTLVTNGEYPLNFELSTDCIKREAFTQIINEMLNMDASFWKKLTPANIIEVQNLEKAFGIEVACPLCFVEAKRLNVLSWATGVAEKWNTALKAVAPGVEHTPFEFYKEGDMTVDQVERKNGEVLITQRVKQEIDTINSFLGDSKNLRDKDAKRLRDNAKEMEKLLNGWISEYGAEHGGDITGFTLKKKQEAQLEKIRNRNMKSATGRMMRIIASHPEVRHTLSPMDLLGSTGLMRIQSMEGEGFAEMLSAIVSANGTGTPKIVQSAVPYDGEIIDVPQARFEKAAGIGGARLFSFSDADLTKIFDIMQIMWDCAARQAKVQSYSKEVPYIVLFGTSGVKINMSMLPEARPGKDVEQQYKVATKAGKQRIKHAVEENVGLQIDQDGNIVGLDLSDSHSITDEFARWIFHNPEYNANCGAVMVGIGVNHAIYCMMQPHIRMLIPFHLSGMPLAAREKGDVFWYHDFTNEQNTGVMVDGVRVKLMGKDGSIVPSVKEDFNIYTGEEKEDWDIRERCRAYVKWCDDNGLLPKFPWAVNAEGYAKWMRENGYEPRQDFIDEMNAHTTDGVWDEYYKVITDFTAYKPEFDEEGNMIGERSARHLPVTGRFNTDPKLLQAVFGTNAEGTEVTSEESMLNNRERSIENADRHAKEIAALAIDMLNGGKKASDMVDMSGDQFNNKADSELFLQEQELPAPEDVKALEKEQPEAPADVDVSEGGVTMFRERTAPAPQNTRTGYAAFVVLPDGKGGYALYPKMVQAEGGQGTPVLTWLDAETGNIRRDENGDIITNTLGRIQVQDSSINKKGKANKGQGLAWRPGKHLAEYPNATQFAVKNPKTGKKDVMQDNIIFFKVSYAADKDYQTEAWEYGFNKNGKYNHSQAGLPYIPKDGYYKYRTNVNPDIPAMIITGSYKIEEALTDEQAKAINQEFGGTWLEREGGKPVDETRLRELGLAKDQLDARRDAYDFSAIQQGRDESSQVMTLEGYTPRAINFDDENLKDAAKENGQDLDAYREGYQSPEERGWKREDYTGGGTRFREAAPVFVSNADQALGRIKMDKATPEQWLKMLEKEGGLKSGEDKWIGLSDWLKSSDRKTITKQEVADYIAQNEIQVEEVVYGDNLQDEIKNTIGRGRELSELQDEIDELKESDDYQTIGDAWLRDEWLRDEMKERYGEDFEMGYVIDDGRIDYEIDPFIDRDYRENYEGPTRPINGIRAQYTTDGLENKREIALTVPTIEPWNQGDDIHFGDAGNGRAVAWIRFGDAVSGGKGKIALDELERELAHKYQCPPYRLRELASEDDIARLDAAQEAVNEDYRNGISGKKVLVIDEIQSKRHQEGREKGYKTTYDEREKALFEKFPEYKEVMEGHKRAAELKREIESGTGRPLTGLFKEDFEKYKSEIHEFNELENAYHLYMNNHGKELQEYADSLDGRIPKAPFEKNWHELAMKRMLRLAAEEGYDYVAWTTGAQQAERYDIGGAVDNISYHGEYHGLKLIDINLKTGRGGIIHLGVNDDGVIEETYNGDGDTLSSSEYNGRDLAELIGKENAEKVMALDEEESSISGGDLRVGGDGMKGFYDDILPRFMNKYGKKWGVKVSDITLPNVEEAGRVMHAVPVTPEMKESVMQGQTMFRVTPEQDAEYMSAVEAGDMEKAGQMVRDAASLAMPDTKVLDKEGRPAVVYHGTHTYGFTEFERPGEDINGLIWTTPDKEYADGYTRQYSDSPVPGVYDLFVNLKNPVDLGNINDVVGSGTWNKIADKLGMSPKDLFDALNDFPRTTYDEVSSVSGAAEYMPLYPIYEYTRTDKFVNLLNDRGFDGVIALEKVGYSDDLVTTYGVVNPSQVKSADPVTYDDNGNVIPLSERFNPENDDIRFRERTPEDARSAQVGYEEEIQRNVTNFLLEWQNEDIPVRIAINQVMNEIGKDRLSEDEDYLTRHNLVSSRADAQMHKYKLFYFEPMMEAICRIEDVLVGGKPSVFDRLTGRRQKRMDAYGRIVDYCYAVSGLERNEWKRAEAQELKRKAVERLAEAWAKETEAINADSRLTEEEKDAAIKRADNKYAKDRDALDEKYADRDYSGITALMGRPAEEWQEAEADAQRMINLFRTEMRDAFWTDGKSGADAQAEADALIDEMWDRIRDCTDFNLEHAYKYGLLSRAEYERLHGTESQPRMWNYYLPLRGFAERTAEDEYAYSMFTNDSAGGDVVKQAKGRTTRADDPFAVMRHISELEIVQGLQNWAKQALYNFVLNAEGNTLLTQVEPWYVKEQGTDNWIAAEPKSKDAGDEKDESLEEFEERMQEAQRRGDARRGRNGLKLGLILANKMHRNQHMIRLKINGAEKMIWVNGDPVLAQSVNGVHGWNNWYTQMVGKVNRRLSQFYTTYSLKFLTKNKMRDTQFSRIAALVDEGQPYLRQLEKNWWANNGYVAFGYPMMRLVSEWESGELEKKESRTEREQMFIDFMYDGGATGYTIINSMDKIKRELERMVNNAGRGERNIPVIDWYAKCVGALNEAGELLTRFTFYQTSRQMGRSRERSAYDAKESSVNFNRRGLRSGKGFYGWTAAAASTLYLFINPAIQGLDRFVRLHKSHPWKMGLVDATYFMMGFVNSLLNAMIAGVSDGGDDDEKKMGPDWYWNIPEWVRRSNMIIGSPFKKLGKWGYLVIALPIEYKGFYAMGELVSSLVQGKYAAKDAPTIANEVIGVVSELLPVNPVEGYTPGDNPAMSVVRNMMPDVAAPIMDVATNRSFAGIPLWKENIYDENEPLSQSAFASTPEVLNKAVIKLAEVTSDMPWHVDIPSGAVRGLLKGYGGGAYTFVEDVGKVVFADEAHPRRYENFPFVSGFTGYLEEDRRDSFNSNALNRYKELSGEVVKRIRSAAPGEDISESMVYNHPEDLPKNARVTRLLHSDEWLLGKMYYDGMRKKSGEKEAKVDKRGNLYNVDVKDDINGLRKAWKKAKDEYLEIAKDKNATDDQKEAAEKKVQKAWLKFTQSEDALVDALMEEEYNHVQQKIANGIPYEPKETLGEKAYKLTNRR